MKKILIGFCAFSLVTSFHPSFSDECDIEAFYKEQNVASDALVLTSGDDLEEVELLLVPVDVNKGNYVVDLTRKASNLYKVDGKNLYVKTRYCYEYCTSDEVILKVEGSYGYTKGKIIFE